MKRIIALILSVTMLLTLFTGLSVSATNTEDGSILVLNTGDAVIYGKSYISTFKNWANPESEYDVTFTQTASVAGIGYEGGVVMDCEVPTGQQPCVRFYTMTLKPNVTVNKANNLFGLYVKFPTYVADALPANRRWNEVTRFNYLTIAQGGNTFTTSSFSGMSFKKLAADGSAWANDSIANGSNSFGTSVSGFEGYIMMDLSSLPEYGTWVENGFDADADYTVTAVEFYNTCVGGVCGEFSVGGWYGVDVDSTSTQAQIKGAPVTLNLSTFDTNPIVANLPKNGTFSFGPTGTTPPWNMNTNTTEAYPNTYDTTIATVAHLTNCIGTQTGVKISAKTASGYLTEQPVNFYSNLNTSGTTDGVADTMLYLELPETGLGYNSFKLTGVVYDGYGYEELMNKEFKYLPINGSTWMTSTITTAREFILPDGFKGYIVIPFSRTDLSMWKIEFQIGAYGGDYGDAYIGGVFDISVNNDSIYMSLGGAQAVRLTDGTAVSPIQGTYYNAAYESESNVIGGAPNHLSIVNNPNNAVTAKWAANCEEIGTHLMRTAVSDTAVNNVKVKVNPWVNVDKDANTAMVYMEVPSAPSNASWQIKLTGMTFHQNNANVQADKNLNDYYWTNSRGMQYSYLSSDSTKWVNGAISTDGNEIFTLPNGFKGYVKFDFSTCPNYRGEWTNTTAGNLYEKKNFDYTMDYNFGEFNFEFNYFGGEYGNFVLGPWTSVTYDSTSLYAQISNSTTSENGAPESLSIYANVNGMNFEKVVANIEEIGEVTVEDVALVEETIECYNSLPAAYIARFTEEQQAAYDAIVEAFAAYRPDFKGVSILVPTGADEAGIRVGVTVDGSAAAKDGYYVAEYGTVMLTALNPLNIKFGTDASGAVVNSLTNSDASKTAFDMDTYYVAESWVDYTKRLYFRSFITYSNGTDSYTVYNGNYDNTYRVSSEQYEAPNLDEVGKHYAIKITTSDPYLYTGITLAANAFGVTVLDGYAYGNLNGDCDIVSGNLLAEHIDAADLAIARKYLLGKEKLSNWYVADVDGNGEVDIKDLVRFKKYLAGEDVDFGVKKKITKLEFATGMDMFGEKSINIIGDSISQGIGAAKMYDESWASLFKGAANDYWGSDNIGYVSFNDGYADDFASESNYKEIHKLTVSSEQWVKKSGYETATPGSYCYVSKNTDTDSVITIALNRKEGGIDRHINGFYIYHSVGAGYGSFNVKVNGEAVTTVDCVAAANSHYARSEYIALPEGCGDELTIEIVKPASVTGTVSINGISYIDKPDAPTVNNYALSGVRLCEFDDELLRQLSKANTVILTLGTNDVNTDGVYDWGSNITLFKQKLNVIVEACKANGSTLIVGDVIWDLDNKEVAPQYKQALREAADAANGYFIDFTTLDMNNGMADKLHPNANGYRLIANMLCEFFGLQLF